MLRNQKKCSGTSLLEAYFRSFTSNIYRATTILTQDHSYSKDEATSPLRADPSKIRLMYFMS